MVTIYDIAEKTNLSPSTVARALNNSGYCSKEAKEKVMSAADELGYVPHQAAKTLKNSITNKIMLCIPDIMNPYYFGMIKGVTEALEPYGYSVILGYTEHSRKKELEVLNSLKGRFVDGLVFGSFNYDDELIEAIKETTLPTAITSMYQHSSDNNFYDCVYMDQPNASWAATMHCLEMGHREIVFVGGDPLEQNTRERFAGYKRALSEYGLSVNDDLLIQGHFTREGAHAAFSDFIKSGKKCTAAVACNDLMGVGCMIACREAGLVVPDDISLVSLDNTDYCLCTYPAMTSVDMMQDQVGRSSAEFVMDRIINKREFRKDMAFSPNLVIRDSVKRINL